MPPLTPQGPGSHTGLPFSADESVYLSIPGGPAFTRLIFTDPTPFGNPWNVPAGVTSIDVLMVGGGGGGIFGPDDLSGTLLMPGGGSGGGGVVVQNNIPVTPGHSLTVFVGPGGVGATNTALGATAGGESFIRNNTLGGITIAGPAGGGGVCGWSTSPPIDGQPANGSGAGGSYDILAATPIPPSNPDGGGGLGGAGAAGTILDEMAGGGGGGALSGGGAGISGTGGNPGTPGNGGDGKTPAPSSFGPWGNDIGENGKFGGGGWSRDGRLAGWTISTRGIGGGAPNTGGGAGPSVAPTMDGEDGYSGIVVVIYATP